VVCRSVCLSVTTVRLAKTAASIEIPFGLRTGVGPGNHVLDAGPHPPWEGAILRGSGVPLESIWTLCGHLCKEGRTDRDAVWVLGSDGPRESCVRWESTDAEGHCHGNQFWEENCYNWLCVNDSD